MIEHYGAEVVELYETEIKLREKMKEITKRKQAVYQQLLELLVQTDRRGLQIDDIMILREEYATTKKLGKNDMEEYVKNIINNSNMTNEDKEKSIKELYKGEKIYRERLKVINLSKRN